jgi:hypothetical protein
LRGLAERSRVLAPIVAWARSRSDVIGVAVVGSVARGTTTPDSDLDLMILASEPHTFRDDGAWLQEIHFGCDIRAVGWHDAEYGAAWSRHVRVAQQGEIEFTFVAPSWAATDPIDPGTAAVVTDGCRVLLDKPGQFDRLLTAVACANGVQTASP